MGHTPVPLLFGDPTDVTLAVESKEVDSNVLESWEKASVVTMPRCAFLTVMSVRIPFDPTTIMVPSIVPLDIIGKKIMIFKEIKPCYLLKLSTR